MPDFSICRNRSCLIQDSCYRFLAEPSTIHQSYTVFHPIIDEQGNFVDCEHFKPLPEFKKKTESKFLRDLHKGYFIYELSPDKTRIFYEITSPEPLDTTPFSFDTLEECKKYIDEHLITKS